MVYIPIEARMGIQPIAVSSLTQNHDLGTIIRARDPIYGEGEFIYLVGVLGTVIGSVVIWEGQSSGNPTYQTTLAPASINLGQPLAVAMAANVAGHYGWYQIGGNAVARTNGTLTGGNLPVYLAGAGQVTSTATPGLRVLDAVSITASGSPSSGLAVIEIDRPLAQDTTGGVAIPAQRAIRSSADLPITSNDEFLNVAVSAPLTVPIPAASGRTGVRLRFEDVLGNWTTNNITFNRSGADTFDGLTTLTANLNYGWIEFTPMNDGVNAGYKVTGIFR